MTKTKMSKYPTPKFVSLEEEEEYWKSHSPLVEGYEGKIQKTKQQRNSFLSVRLTGEELSRLREQALFHHITPSAYVRKVILEAVDKRPMPGDLIRSTILQEFVRTECEKDSSFEKAVKEAMKAYSEYMTKETEVFGLIADSFLERKLGKSKSEKITDGSSK